MPIDATPTPEMIEGLAKELDAERPHERITVALWISGGVVDGARASHPGVDLVIYDQDDLEQEEGEDHEDDDPVTIAELKYESLPYGAY